MSFFCSESNRKELKAMAKLCRNFQSDSICSNHKGAEEERAKRGRGRSRGRGRAEHGSHGAPCLTSSSVSSGLAIIISKLQIHKTYAKLCAMSALRFDPLGWPESPRVLCLFIPLDGPPPRRSARHHPAVPSCIFVSLHLSAAICRCFCC